MKEDWIECELQEVFETVTGNTPSKKEIDNYGQDIPFIKPPDITNSAINSTSEYLSLKGKKTARILPKNSILITCIGNLGRVGFNKEEVAFNQQINAILPIENVDYKFIFFQAQSGNFRNQLESLSTSTTVALVNKSSFNSVKIDLAPLPIQRAIVSKIEALFSDLDNGIANFKKAQAQLKIYRQAVLKKAFEGELTKEWREDYVKTDGRPSQPASQLPTAEELQQQIKEERQNHSSENLPKGWNIKMISDVADTFGGYAFKSGDFKEKGNYQVVRMGNVRPGILRYNESPVFLSEVIENVLEKALLKVNDLIITQTGTKGKRDYGFTVLISKDNLLLNQRIAAIRCKEKCLPKYLLYYTWTDKFKNQFFENETGNVGQGNVGMKAVTNTLIDIPSLQEQHQIVAEIERRLSVCDKMEQSITESLAKAEALRQSILKKAFEGNLLSQAEIEQCKKEADYEPASVLLARIKQSRNEKIQADKVKTAGHPSQRASLLKQLPRIKNKTQK